MFLKFLCHACFRGVDVLHKKSELKKEMERRKDLQKKKEEEEHYRSKRSSFEQKLEEQANKLKQVREGVCSGMVMLYFRSHPVLFF